MLLREHAMDNYKGRVSSIETFGSVDGPGVRFVVFLQGCNMRCKYCHNPETWNLQGGEEYTPEKLFEKAYRYRTYWGNNMENGGITVSGGEPLLQIEFVTELFRLASEKGVHTTLDTSGQPFNNDEKWLSKFDELMKYTNLVILDFKEFDCVKHKALTGCGNENIFEMAKYLSNIGKPMWIRHVLVPDLTDDYQNLSDLGQFINTLETVERIENLPYHTLGIFKWEKLKIKYPLLGVRTPTVEEIARADEILIKKSL